MDYLAKEAHRNYNKTYPLSKISREVTAFSDSIVISYELSSKIGTVFHILLDLVFLQVDLLARGFILRGGVVVGDLYHNMNIVFGPAMVEAYELETKHAKNPRIILSIDTIIQGIRYAPVQNSPEEELEYILSLLRKDRDGYYFLDYLRQDQEFDNHELYINFLGIVKKFILEGLSLSQSDKKVHRKYEWLKRYYNLTIKNRFNKKYRESMNLML